MRPRYVAPLYIETLAILQWTNEPARHEHTDEKRHLTPTSIIVPSRARSSCVSLQRFKSAFIIFSAEKHKLIKEELAKEGRAEKVWTLHCCGQTTNPLLIQQ
jgi:hypothetical protein